MTILIAPIGVKTDHVKTWLREVSNDAEILWLVHSKKNEKYDFPKIAKDLARDIKKSNSQIEIKFKAIDDSFSIEPTYDTITEIIRTEEEENNELVLKNQQTQPLIRKDFILNITGGTNAMAAATMTAATFWGTTAHYIVEPQKGDPRGKKYVIDLPVKPIGSAKMNEAHKKVLGLVADGKYVIENTPVGLNPAPINGRITRKQILEGMGWTTKKSTTLNGITAKLEKDGMITSTGYGEYYVLPNGKRLEGNSKLDMSVNPPAVKYTEFYRGGTRQMYAKWPLKIEKNLRETIFEITTLGRLTSRHSMMV